MEYTEKCYDHFMNGGDAFEEMDAELQAKLSKGGHLNLLLQGTTCRLVEFWALSHLLPSLQGL